MRKIFLLLALLPIFTLLLVSCDDDDDNNYEQLWYSFASLIKDNDANVHYYDLDSGGKLIPTNNLDVSEFNDSARVVVTYVIASETGEEESLEVRAEIRLVREILTKDIFTLTDENVDSIGNDALLTSENNIWNSDNHLNIVFAYWGYNQTHYINLCKPIGTQVDSNGYQILELRHNSNDDFETYQYNSEVSFDMRSLQDPGMDSVNFILKAIENDTNNFVYYGTFHFNQPEPASMIIPASSYGSPLLIE